MQVFQYYFRLNSTIPEDGLIGAVNYGASVPVGYGAKAAGTATYSRRLTDAEMDTNGLVPTDAVHVYSVTVKWTGASTMAIIVRANTFTEVVQSIADKGDIAWMRLTQII